MNNNSTETKVNKLPNCDMCEKEGITTKALFDGKTVLGPWAFMCFECFEIYGTGLGLGNGQKLITE